MRPFCAFSISIVFAFTVALAGCGVHSGSPSTTPTPSPDSDLSWANSANGTTVLDSSGTPYYFSAATGCMYNKNSKVGPDNFCLTPSTSQSTGYTYYGATGCTNPGSNSACNTATFDVLLTNNPSGTGCIAVLGNGTSSPTVLAAYLSVVENNNSFAISGIQDLNGYVGAVVPSATGYKTYWNGAIPDCGGSNTYAGTYTSTTYATSNWQQFEGNCLTPTPVNTNARGSLVGGDRNADRRASVTSSPNVAARSGNLTFTIDSGGIIDSEGSYLSGLVGSPVTTTVIDGAYVLPNGGPGCTPIVSITSATQNTAGKWIFAGTEAFAEVTTPFTATQN